MVLVVQPIRVGLISLVILVLVVLIVLVLIIGLAPRALLLGPPNPRLATVLVLVPVLAPGAVVILAPGSCGIPGPGPSPSAGSRRALAQP